MAREGKWLTVGEVAELLEVSVQAFHQTYRPLILAADVREDGRRTLIRVRGLIDAWVKHRERQAVAALGGDADMAGGGDSPWLEAYRKQRAQQEEIKLGRMRGETVALSELRTELAKVFGALRRGIERLQREHGNSVADLVIEPLVEAEAGIEVVIGRVGGASTTQSVGQPAGAVPGAGLLPDDPATAAADDAAVRGAGDRADDGALPGKPVQVRKKSVRGAAAGPVRRSGGSGGGGGRKVEKAVRHRAKPKR
jgi:hypothetical protein